MSGGLKTEFDHFEQSHREFITAFTLLTTKKIKSRAPEARKALMNIINSAKDLRKLIQEFKEKI